MADDKRDFGAFTDAGTSGKSFGFPPPEEIYDEREAYRIMNRLKKKGFSEAAKEYGNRGSVLSEARVESSMGAITFKEALKKRGIKPTTKEQERKIRAASGQQEEKSKPQTGGKPTISGTSEDRLTDEEKQAAIDRYFSGQAMLDPKRFFELARSSEPSEFLPNVLFGEDHNIPPEANRPKPRGGEFQALRESSGVTRKFEGPEKPEEPPEPSTEDIQERARNTRENINETINTSLQDLFEDAMQSIKDKGERPKEFDNKMKKVGRYVNKIKKRAGPVISESKQALNDAVNRQVEVLNQLGERGEGPRTHPLLADMFLSDREKFERQADRFWEKLKIDKERLRLQWKELEMMQKYRMISALGQLLGSVTQGSQGMPKQVEMFLDTQQDVITTLLDQAYQTAEDEDDFQKITRELFKKDSAVQKLMSSYMNNLGLTEGGTEFQAPDLGPLLSLGNGLLQVISGGAWGASGFEWVNPFAQSGQAGQGTGGGQETGASERQGGVRINEEQLEEMYRQLGEGTGYEEFMNRLRSAMGGQ